MNEKRVLLIDDEAVGMVVRTRPGVRPVFVSPGHLIDIDSSVRIVLETIGRFRLPEPTRLAHHATTTMQRALDRRVRPASRRTYPDFVPG